MDRDQTSHFLLSTFDGKRRGNVFWGDWGKVWCETDQIRVDFRRAYRWELIGMNGERIGIPIPVFAQDQSKMTEFFGRQVPAAGSNR